MHLVREFICLIAAVCSIPLGAVNWDLVTPVSEVAVGPIDRPVLLVHGYLHNASAWLFHRRALQQAGFRAIYTLNLGCPLHSIEEYADVVQTKVSQIAAETGRTDLILIGHSMGGLVCSYYATQQAPEGTVTHVITLGSPLDGTRLASVAIGECSRQMCYKSAFTQWLQKEINACPHIQFFHLESSADLVVWPQSPFKTNCEHIQRKIYHDLGHFGFLYSVEVTSDMIHFLLDEGSDMR